MSAIKETTKRKALSFPIEKTEQLKLKSIEPSTAQEEQTQQEQDNFAEMSDSESDSTVEVLNASSTNKKKRSHAYVPKRAPPATCTEFFRRGQNTIRCRLPYFFNRSVTFSTSTPMNHFPWEDLVREASQSPLGKSAEHIFDMAQQVSVSAGITFCFKTKTGQGIVDKKILDEYATYLNSCEQDALADNSFGNKA